jgi:dihydrofolate reductase
VFIATSADGFIAREDGATDWLERPHAGAAPGEDFGYQAFSDAVDALAMGRRTFEVVRGFDAWPFGDKPVVVLSRQGVEVPPALGATASVRADAPRALLERLGAQVRREVYLDGGLAVQSFLREGVVDELIVTTVPVLIGRGRPLFGPLAGDVALELVGSRAYAGGCVQNRSAANLNIHLHCLVLDGADRCDADGAQIFVEAAAPTDDELHALLQTVIARLMKLLTRRGVLVEDMGQTYLAEPDADGEEVRTLAWISTDPS